VPVVGQTFPLDRAADAHATLEVRTAIGKTLLLTDSLAVAGSIPGRAVRRTDGPTTNGGDL